MQKFRDFLKHGPYVVVILVVANGHGRMTLHHEGISNISAKSGLNLFEKWVRAEQSN